jgi:hypothetical protein
VGDSCAGAVATESIKPEVVVMFSFEMKLGSDPCYSKTKKNLSSMQRDGVTLIN